jgi:hypothetical protein
MLCSFWCVVLSVVRKHVCHEKLVKQKSSVGGYRPSAAIGVQNLAICHAQKKQTDIVEYNPKH